MFSPDEQKQIQAKSLQQWQQEQRALKERESVAEKFQEIFGVDVRSLLGVQPPDPLFNHNDRQLLKSLHISPA